MKYVTKIFANFVSHKVVTFNDRDPPLMKYFIKGKIEWKIEVYKTYIKDW